MTVDAIVNRRGGLNSSLYQSCLALRKRLAEVPGFEPYLTEMDLEEQESDDETDPVTSMWNMLRRGFPLMTIYNALQPRVPLEVNSSRVTESKLGKAATFKFLQACLEELKFPANECFLITDLYGQDTTGFVKVLKVVKRVLDTLEQRGLLLDTQDQGGNGDAGEPQIRNHQQNIIEELVSTERDYVQHLETLQQFKNQLEQSGAIPGDVVHEIFLNLNALLDFQRRFLIRIEQQNSLDPAIQNWGHLFAQYQDSFRVYEPFIANQIQCNNAVMREWDKIKSAPLSPALSGMVSSHTVLTGFLLKPFQRLAKYPLLLDELHKKGDFGTEKRIDLEKGAEATKSILDGANAAIDKVKRLQDVNELVNTVDDWKGHRLEHFGELVLSGGHTVLKGEGTKEVEREYKIYLFERILLCCKEMNPNKAKSRLPSKSMEKKGKPRLQLKGRIFMQNVTDVCSFSKSGSYLLQIFWKGDPGVENFVIRFLTAEVRDRWAQLVEKQRRSLSKSNRDPAFSSISQTEFTSMSGAVLHNPYNEQDDDDDEEEIRTSMASTLVNSQSGFSSSRNASTTSLRSRSTTGGSGPPTTGIAAVGLPTRLPPPRFPMAEVGSTPALKLSTSFTNTTTPDERNGNASYFSPTCESPSSMRSGSQASMYHFPRQHAQPNSSWAPDGNKHNTAPPMGRAPTRDDEMPNGYSSGGRNIQRPSLLALASSQNAQNRSRSLSSPDIHNPHSPGKRSLNSHLQSGAEDIPVPPIPPHMASMRVPVNRSQNNSPTESLRSARNGNSAQTLSRAPHTYHPAYDAGHVRPDPRYPPHMGHGPKAAAPQRMMSPQMSAPSAQGDAPYVSQLKVKIFFEPKPSHVTIVVPIIIKHRSLIDRIDSKMEKVTSSSIAKGSARLRYVDSENELITITNDEDVQLAIEEWVIEHDQELRNGIIPDFELHWHEIPHGLSNLAI